ncbi:hypothetical protein GCM10010329_77050 [Streptomyces spiroverticillatus]|uniref:Uncharacterized protein n=1 Tax=Streptomyces finlayi TaxID=67296 RepID=A0A918X5D2_9ACTN|nr:hypothetical protein [Streptomyces finlayi]GHA42757.1 hypothetical protein GCM10010329_77050 [Streptomyces spiroverticillatus]GHD13818.1 hypothetical protein GCM10010334_72460 [Streptomyces finlayi]
MSNPVALPSPQKLYDLFAPLYPLVDEREAMAEIASRLRTATDPDQLAERDRAGNRMADLDYEIHDRTARALDRIGLEGPAAALGALLEEFHDDVAAAYKAQQLREHITEGFTTHAPFDVRTVRSTE